MTGLIECVRHGEDCVTIRMRYTHNGVLIRRDDWSEEDTDRARQMARLSLGGCIKEGNAESTDRFVRYHRNDGGHSYKTAPGLEDVRRHMARHPAKLHGQSYGAWMCSSFYGHVVVLLRADGDTIQEQAQKDGSSHWMMAPFDQWAPLTATMEPAFLPGEE